MIEDLGGRFRVSCDRCGFSFETHTGIDLLYKRKGFGWFKQDEKDICNSCHVELHGGWGKIPGDQ